MITSGAKLAGEMHEAAAIPLRVIDDEHLERITLGDRHLEREVLQIFVRQSAMMLERISGAQSTVLFTAAHTLIGSARGVGAWRVADAAERLERASREGRSEDISEAIADLKAASLEATAAIAARLAKPSH
jgi:HPt (histidine-containing phosphotransfer) domain-containing protein